MGEAPSAVRTMCGPKWPHMRDRTGILGDMSADVAHDGSTLTVPIGPGAEASTGPRDGPRLSLLVATMVISISVAMGVRPVSDPSPWLHLKIGAFLLDGGRFGSPDPWASFASRVYVPTEWLSAILGQETYQAFGLPGIAWMRCAGILGLLSALVWSARRSTDSTTAVVVAFVALVGAYNGLTERPQLLGLVFLAVAVGAWWRTALDLRPRWWLVPMTWLWASTIEPIAGQVHAGILAVRHDAGEVDDRRVD